jgi:hypothetical protein
MRSHDTVCNDVKEPHSGPVESNGTDGEENEVFFEANLFLNQE